MNYLVIDKIIKDAIVEDIPNEDITTNSIINENSISTVELLCKEDGIVAGLEVFKRVFDILGNVEIEFYKHDGDMVYAKDKVAFLKGNTRNLLIGERIALNLLQRMSGIATLTNKFVKEIIHTILEKYSVKIGGGCNHRFNLSDSVMLKDNHISAAGGIKNAVELARKNSSFVRKIEVEAESLEMVREALEVKADIIMLDNMNLDVAKKAVELIDGRALI